VEEGGDGGKVDRQQSNESHKSDVSEGAGLRDKEGEEGEENGVGEEVGDLNRSGMRLLFTLLQDFFREYINSMLLVRVFFNVTCYVHGQ
jgi:hypothetical protein